MKKIKLSYLIISACVSLSMKMHSQTAQLFKDLKNGSQGSNPSHFTQVGSDIYFTAAAPANSPYELALWKTDGNSDHVNLIYEFKYSLSLVRNIHPVGDNIFIFASGDAAQGYELLKTDGTSAGTSLVKDINPGPNGSWSIYTLYDKNTSFSIGNIIYFAADDNVHGGELWRSDGTSSGTYLVSDIYPGSFGSAVKNFVQLNGELYFTANDGIHGFELWKSDGTSAGTSMVKDIYSGTTSGIPISSSVFTFKILKSDSILYFAANDSLHGPEVWRSDGTSLGTYMLIEICSGIYGSSPYSLTDINGSVYFMHQQTSSGSKQLWKSDGTSGGTVKVQEWQNGTGPGFYEGVGVSGTFYFSADDGSYGSELWKSDGTSAGTIMVRDIAPGSSNGFNGFGEYAINTSGILYFRNSNYTSGAGQLWKTDGTASGTVSIKEFSLASNTSPANLAMIGDSLFFSANDGIYGNELWICSGSGGNGVNDNPIVETPIYVFPNPNNGNFVLKFDNAEKSEVEIEMYNLMGALIYKEKIASSEALSHKINVPLGESGVYLLQVKSGQLKRASKIIIN